MKFVIYTPVYTENIGGVIALHKLAQKLTESGHIAKIWPWPKPVPGGGFGLLNLIKCFKWYTYHLFFNYPLITRIKHPYDLELAQSADLNNSIIIYPEVTLGNPLNAAKIIRWFLNRPTNAGRNLTYGSNELYFYYDKHFNDPVINPDPNTHLKIMETFEDIYCVGNHQRDIEQCYIVRKGGDRLKNAHDAGAIKIDGLSHAEIAEIFNRAKYFISYDLYTMYSQYAAMCGCISVVVPLDGMTKYEWNQDEENRYGIAYGFDDIDWAISTMSSIKRVIDDRNRVEEEMLDNFLMKTNNFFN
ncbi:MAG: hypothetical protein U1E13_00220 [Methylophilaceae bacterium]|nr:hypothetical protein [Methylophilaceae bacterium]